MNYALQNELKLPDSAKDDEFHAQYMTEWDARWLWVLLVQVRVGDVNHMDCSQGYKKQPLASSGVSVRIELGSNWMDSYEIWYMSIFQKCVHKIQVSYYEKNVYFTWETVNIFYYI
jgi:hypothetical protein